MSFHQLLLDTLEQRTAAYRSARHSSAPAPAFPDPLAEPGARWRGAELIGLGGPAPASPLWTRGRLREFFAMPLVAANDRPQSIPRIVAHLDPLSRSLDPIGHRSSLGGIRRGLRPVPGFPEVAGRSEPTGASA
ncbi:MAG: hypothetical protein MI919_28335 [Holophagales bacterium]|nr:hypothetical protein [Holophagales bacterium]